jgi:acetyl-CoA synthetase
LRWLGKNGAVKDYSYRLLDELRNRFANALRRLGVGKGDRVYVLAGRIPELYIAALGTLKNRSVFCPLFSAFCPEPIRARMTIGQANVPVTTEPLYHRKVAGIRGSLPDLEHVLLIGDDGSPTGVPGTEDYHRLLEQADSEFTIGPADPEDMALLHFTSGTTGTPKGAVHVHQAVVAHHITGKYASDLHQHDIFWCTADPGWVTGTSYGIIAPLTNGVTSIVDEGDAAGSPSRRARARAEALGRHSPPLIRGEPQGGIACFFGDGAVAETAMRIGITRRRLGDGRGHRRRDR